MSEIQAGDMDSDLSDSDVLEHFSFRASNSRKRGRDYSDDEEDAPAPSPPAQASQKTVR